LPSLLATLPFTRSLILKTFTFCPISIAMNLS
jgi:hypothetical protein